MNPPNNWAEKLSCLPNDLRAKKIWCIWRYEEREGKQTKVPYQPTSATTVQLARSNDPTTWVTFAEACAAADSDDTFRVGVFTDGAYAFVDLDHCVTNGTIEPWALAVLARTNSYAEFSPSGTGIHVFIAGTVAQASKINGCEIYSANRYFTVTGAQIEGTPSVINAMSADALNELRQDIADDQLRPAQPSDVKPTRSNFVIERSLTQSEREAKLARALSGDISEYGNNRSSAVHGALQLLARKLNGDRERMQEEFEKSELCDAWGAKWSRLADNELDKALARWRENGCPAWGDRREHAEWKLVRYSSIQAKPIQWFWRGYLAAGKLTMLNGEPSHGKSLVSVDTAARVTRQMPWADGQKNELPPSSVLLLTEEEDPEDTIKPRFLAAGGDPDKLITLHMGAELFRIEEHTERLKKLILDEAPDTRLIILDPVSDYTTVDTHKDSEVRPMLTKLVRLAGELDIAILGINHLNKKTDMSAMHRVSGARAWVSVARLNFLVGKGETEMRHLVPLKLNVAKDDRSSLDYVIESAKIQDGSLVISSIPKIKWSGKG